MPNVPYNPVPQEGPVQGGPGPVRVDVQPGAFGAGVANALGGFATQMERSSNEIFGRAVAMQTVANEATAREAETQYTIESGILQSEFMASQGWNAVNGQRKHSEALQALRQKYREGLPNDHTRKLYDTHTLGTLSGNVVRAAGHSATELKQVNIGSIKHQMEVDAKTVEAEPGDEVGFQRKIDKTVGNAKQLAAAEGMPAGGAYERNLILTQTSKLFLGKANGLSQLEPEKAKEFVEANRTRFTEEDLATAERTVIAKGRTVASQRIADGIWERGQGDATTPPKSLAQMEKEAAAEAQRMFPKDPLIAKNAALAVQNKYSTARTAEKSESIEAWEVINAAIARGARNRQELEANPRVAKIIDSMPESEKIKIDGVINQRVTQRNKNAWDANDNRLTEMSNGDTETYLGLHIPSQDLSPDDINKHLDRQKRLLHAPEGNPVTSRFISYMRADFAQELKALNLHIPSAGTQNNQALFKGRVTTALDEWKALNKKFPSYEEFKKHIVPTILKKEVTPGILGGLFGDNVTHQYNRPVPAEFAKGLIDAAKKDGRPVPDEAALRRAYNKMDFEREYKKAREQKP